jgi:hypothetical protein
MVGCTNIMLIKTRVVTNFACIFYRLTAILENNLDDGLEYFSKYDRQRIETEYRIGLGDKVIDEIKKVKNQFFGNKKNIIVSFPQI